MATDVVIEVDRVWKRFRRGELHDSLRDLLPAVLRRMRAGANQKEPLEERDFWALRDVSMQICRGEAFGLIGPNGAGKSTLLKILSRVLKPNAGEVFVRGRLGALIEVAAGFHPDLTGRENIYLNGTILGMKRREIDFKLDQIVAFAGIDAFLDTPVKRYSSGMQARLGFAVAAHLEPDILIVDEVLAVGDLAFQRKCLARMRDIGASGKTVLFVSHSMATIQSLCDRAAFLDKGRLVQVGKVAETVALYRHRLNPASIGPRQLVGQGGCPPRVLKTIELLDKEGKQTNCIPLGGQLHLRIGLNPDPSIGYPVIGIGFDDALGNRLLSLHSPGHHLELASLNEPCSVDCLIPFFPLAPGEYSIKLALNAHARELESIERSLDITVEDADIFGDGRGFHRGICVAAATWHVS